MPPRNRPRVERAQSTSGTETQAEFLATLRESLPDIAEAWVKAAQTDPKIATEIVTLLRDDFTRARAGDQDELLLRLKSVRESGSPMLQDYWAKVYKRA